MKIEIHKSGTASEIFIDGQLVSHGCMGWEVISKGGGFAELTIRFIAKETDINFNVDNPLKQTPKVQEQKKFHQLFRPNSTKC